MLATGLCAALLASTVPLGAQTDDENARRHFESGAAYLQQSDNENALREFQAAYALSKRPELLLNIANVYERMGRLKEAVDALTKYLEEEPKTPNRTTIETRIANLKKRIEFASAASPAAPVTTTAPKPAASGAPTSPPASSTTTPARRSTPNRTPAYIAFGLGGVAAAGAVVTGLIAQNKFSKAEDTCKPNCSDGTLSSIRSMALVSDILTGVAVAGVGIGAVLFLTAKPTSESASSRRPSFTAGVAPGAARVEATWHF